MVGEETVVDGGVVQRLEAENADLRRRLDEAEQTIEAIRTGGVDAFLVDETTGERVYTLETADRPYRVFVENMGQGALTLSADGTALYCNPRLGELLATAPETLTGRTLCELIPGLEQAAYEAILRSGRSALQGFETVLVREDGARVPVHFSASPLPPEGGAALCALVTDLTERRNYEELRRDQDALRESEEWFRTLAEAVPAIVSYTNAAGEMQYLNSRWFEYTGRTESTSVPEEWASAVHPDDRERATSRLKRATEGGEPYEVELRLLRHDGVYRWFLGRARPVRSRTGEITRWVGSFTDIDEIKRAEQALEEADRRKDEFLATLAHELRNPLAPIRSAVELMGQIDPASDEAARLRGTIETQVGHLTRLIDDLLDVSRITRNRIELKLERLDLRDVIRQACDIASAVIRNAGLMFDFEQSPDPLLMDGDSTRLAQVVSNLLNNAMKYTPCGGRVSLTTERLGSDAIIRVSDSGIGLPADMLDRIFEPFTQVDSSLTRAQGGLGIGLALVERLVRLHGGSVSAASDGPNTGSTFTIRLPLLVEASYTPASDNPVALRPLPARSVLVVDDMRVSAMMLARQFEMLGQNVRFACDGFTALEEIEADLPDLIVSDISMPGMSGYELAREIRQRAYCSNVVLVAVTGLGQDEDKRKATEAGFDRHLVKPAGMDDLHRLLSSLVSATNDTRDREEATCSDAN